jgi:hypothetical protein
VCFAATDNAGNTGECSYSVNVVDTEPPEVNPQQGSISICVDDQMHWVDAATCGIRAFDYCNNTIIVPTVRCVQSDEAISVGTDVVMGSPPAKVSLLAHSNNANGRVYEIVFVATDEAGNQAPATCVVNILPAAFVSAGLDTAINDGLNYALPPGCH